MLAFQYIVISEKRLFLGSKMVCLGLQFRGFSILDQLATLVQESGKSETWQGNSFMVRQEQKDIGGTLFLAAC